MFIPQPISQGMLGVGYLCEMCALFLWESLEATAREAAVKLPLLPAEEGMWLKEVHNPAFVVFCHP